MICVPIVFQYILETCGSTNTEEANFAKHKLYVTANAFGHDCTLQNSSPSVLVGIKMNKFLIQWGSITFFNHWSIKVISELQLLLQIKRKVLFPVVSLFVLYSNCVPIANWLQASLQSVH